MVQYFDSQDNRPVAVSSAHWNDLSANFTSTPRLKTMRKLFIPDSPALIFLYKDTHNIPDIPSTL